MEKIIRRICEDKHTELSPGEQAMVKTYLRNFCEENEVKAFLYVRLFLVCQIDSKREELYDKLVKLLIKLSNCDTDVEFWTLQEILDNKTCTEVNREERDATLQLVLKDSLELINRMVQEHILPQSHLDLRYLAIKLGLRCYDKDILELGKQCNNLAQDFLKLNDDRLLAIEKNLLVAYECLSGLLPSSSWAEWVWHLFEPSSSTSDQSKVGGSKRLLGKADSINLPLPITESCQTKLDFSVCKPITSYEQARTVAQIFLNPSNVTEKILSHMACLDGRRGGANKWKRQSKWHRKR